MPNITIYLSDEEYANYLKDKKNFKKKIKELIDVK